MNRRIFSTVLASSMIHGVAHAQYPSLQRLLSKSSGENDMSHHLDTPLARRNGQLYIDDLYVFEGDHSTVFIMNVNSTITGPDVQPGFHHEARYEFKVHFDGAEFETLTYRVTFDDHPGPDGRQTLQLHALTGREAREESATGTLVLEGRTSETVNGPNTKLWAGRIGDAFYIDLSLLGMVNSAVRKGTHSTCRRGTLRTRRTASPARTSNPSCWRSLTSTRSSGLVLTSAYGAPRNSPLMPAAGGRSTAAGTR